MQNSEEHHYEVEHRSANQREAAPYHSPSDHRQEQAAATSQPSMTSSSQHKEAKAPTHSPTDNERDQAATHSQRPTTAAMNTSPKDRSKVAPTPSPYGKKRGQAAMTSSRPLTTKMDPAPNHRSSVTPAHSSHGNERDRAARTNPPPMRTKVHAAPGDHPRDAPAQPSYGNERHRAAMTSQRSLMTRTNSAPNCHQEVATAHPSWRNEGDRAATSSHQSLMGRTYTAPKGHKEVATAHSSDGNEQERPATSSERFMPTRMDMPPQDSTDTPDFLVSQELNKVQVHLSAERLVSKIFEDAARDLKSQNDDLKELLDEQIRQNEELVASAPSASSRYSVMLVDGDCIQFSTQIGKSSEEDEGALAARTLKSVLKTSLAKESVGGESDLIRICIYGNTGWLADTYTVDGTLADSTSFEAFVKSFNSIDPWTEFITVSSAVNASKDRALETLHHYLRDTRCEAIVFGGEIDDDVVAAFEEHKHTPRRIMIVDQSPITAEVEEPPNEKRFKSSLFRSEPIVSGSDSPSPVKKLEFDELGRRIDPRVIPSQAMIDRVASKTYCNNLYLKGKCTYPRCKHNHTVKLRQAELDALIFLGRSIKCRNGPKCTDEDCYAGHHCPRVSCDGFCGFEKALHFPGTAHEGATDLFPLKVPGLGEELAVSEREAKRIGNEGVSMHMLRRSRALGNPSSTAVTIKKEDEGNSGGRGMSMLEQHGRLKRYTDDEVYPRDGKRARTERIPWR